MANNSGLVLWLGSALAIAHSSFGVAAESAISVDDLFDLDVEQLMQVQASGSATITPTAERRMPAAITAITPRMIKDSGARNLFDLLEIYVPNFHYLPHHYEAAHMGMRSIIGDRDDKYLIVVNGRVLNERTHFGALSERDLPMLGDIQKIEVIRGPGSVVYGPGAVSMVINIQTQNYQQHDDDNLILKAGAGERFQSFELKKSIDLSDRGEHGLLLYGAISNYDGSTADDSPLFYGISGTTPWGQEVNAGQQSSIDPPNYRGSYRNLAKLKLHADYQYKDFRAWVRYTRGGEMLSWEHKVFYAEPNGSATIDTDLSKTEQNRVGYQQLVIDLSQRWVLGENLWLELKGGYDTFDYERVLYNQNFTDEPPETHREEQYLARSTLTWQASNSQSMALGTELAISRYGLDSPGYPHTPAYAFNRQPMQTWEQFALGIFGEHQWQMTNTLTNFIGLRFDKDQYTPVMWSPRWAMVYTPTDRDTFKGILSRSVRKNNAEELRAEHQANKKSDPEKINTAELIYERKFDSNLTLELNAFYSDVEIIGYNSTTLSSSKVADYTVGGAELGLSYRAGSLALYFSHGWSKLDDFDIEPGARQRFSVANEDGYGNDLNNWSNHITKLASAWQIDSNWRLTGDVRVFWDYPGARLATQFAVDQRAAAPISSSTALSDPGYKDPFRKAIFLDLGVHYQLPGSGEISLHGYNLLGLIDDSYNKRIYLNNTQDYRAQASAVGLSYYHPF